jgi:hypothetical protein
MESASLATIDEPISDATEALASAQAKDLMATYFEYAGGLFRTREDAERLARSRGSMKWQGAEPEPPGRVEDQLARIRPVDIDADLVFNDVESIGGWSLWSDGKFRQQVRETYRPENPGVFGRPAGEPMDWLSDRGVRADGAGITPGAVGFIRAVRGADGSNLRAAPWLGQLRDAREGQAATVGPPRSPYAPRKVVPWTLTLADGSTRTCWVFTVGYFEGYEFDGFDTKREAMSGFMPAPDPSGPTECWECGAVFPEPGHVEPGCMS